MSGEVRGSESSSTEREEPLFKELFLVDDDDATALEDRKEIRRQRRRRRRVASFEDGDGFLMFGLRNLELGWKQKCLKKTWKLGRRRWVSLIWIAVFGIVLGFGRREEKCFQGV